MDNEELLSRLGSQSEEDSSEAGQETEEAHIRFLVFSAGERKYALRADEVREITPNNEIFYIPFVPPYIRGYANRYGQPYTVFDLEMLLNNTALDGAHLLILKRDDDQVALLISDVDEFLQVPESAVCSLNADDEISRYFEGMLADDDREIFILAAESILERLERDIEYS